MEIFTNFNNVAVLRVALALMAVSCILNEEECLDDGYLKGNIKKAISVQQKAWPCQVIARFEYFDSTTAHTT